jgi:uncharacterized damage-inducible protein DinB
MDNDSNDLLLDAFSRVHDEFGEVATSLTVEQLSLQPGHGGNSIAWLLWHLARVQDDHVAELAGVEQAWTRDGWYERFGLSLPVGDHGYGHTHEQAASVVVESPSLLTGYHEAVDALSVEYLRGVTSAELARVVDRRWDPPVTVAVRLVSVIGDCMQHLGQAAYIKGFLT